MRYRLRTLLILLAVLPPLLWIGWTKYTAWKAEQARLEQVRRGRIRIWSIDDKGHWTGEFSSAPSPVAESRD